MPGGTYLITPSIAYIDLQKGLITYNLGDKKGLTAKAVFSSLGIKVTEAAKEQAVRRRFKDTYSNKNWGGEDLILMKIFPELKSPLRVNSILYLESRISDKRATLDKQLSQPEKAANRIYDTQPYFKVKEAALQATEQRAEHKTITKPRSSSFRGANAISAAEELAARVAAGKINRVRAKDSITEDNAESTITTS
jgi:hypothetical protein